MKMKSFNNWGDFSGLASFLKSENYRFISYDEVDNLGRVCVLRHDVDLDLQSAVDLALLQSDLGVESTYFLQLRSEFYSLHSKSGVEGVHSLIRSGHKIGLHLDPSFYPTEKFASGISQEKDMLENLTGEECHLVSLHQPTLTGLLDVDLTDLGLRNVSDLSASSFIYLSDSCMNWRMDPNLVVASGKNIQLLLHPEYWNGVWQSLFDVTTILSHSASEGIALKFQNEYTIMSETISKRPFLDGALQKNAANLHELLPIKAPNE